MARLTRRELLTKGLRVAFVAGTATSLFSGCASPGTKKKSLEEVLHSDYYSDLTKGWDPIYGPPLQWFSRYQGPGNFGGHVRAGATPGIDYDVPMYTPVVPMTSSYLRQRTRDWKDVLYVMLIDAYSPGYRMVYAHLDSTLVDEKFLLAGDVMNYLERGVRPLARNEIFGLSGRSGLGPPEYRWRQPPHLHLSLYYVNVNTNTMVYLDPEKYGIDGGRPLFWDGKTRLDGEPGKRVLKLESTLKHLTDEVATWPEGSDLLELKGQLLEYGHLLEGKRGQDILSSKHFHDMRALLKEVILEEKRYRPGTKPYSLALKILGYSTDENQKIILTLPFMAPGLEGLYKKAVYEEGEFLRLVPQGR